MRVVSALDVRKKFGELLDEAAAGERLIIERAGRPLAALVPLTDLPELDRESRVRRRLEAIDDISRISNRPPRAGKLDASALIQEQRVQRAEQIARATRSPRSR